MSFCIALEAVSVCCIKRSIATDTMSRNVAGGESRDDVGITSPEHRCSSSSPGDVRGIELGMEEEPKGTPVGCHTGSAEAEDESWSSCVRCSSVHDTTTMVGVDVMVVPGGGLGLSLVFCA